MNILKDRKLNYHSIFVEFVSIVLGISLALFVDEWRKDYNEQKRLIETMNSIKYELVQNNEEIKEVFASQKTSIDSMLIFLEKDNLSSRRPVEIFTIVGGIEFPDLATATWEATLNDNTLKRMDRDLLRHLTRIESYQGTLARLTDMAFNKVFDIKFFDHGSTKPVLESLLGIIGQMRTTENNLLKYYDMAIKKINEVIKKE